MQKVLIMTTNGQSLRSEAIGSVFEDSDLVVPGFIGRSLSWDYEKYGSHLWYCPLKAMKAGWKLLAPPIEYKETRLDENGFPEPVSYWEWWFVADQL